MELKEGEKHQPLLIIVLSCALQLALTCIIQFNLDIQVFEEGVIRLTLQTNKLGLLRYK